MLFDDDTISRIPIIPGISTAVSPDQYSHKIEAGSLRRGSQIKIKGNFSGQYHGVARADLLTSTGDTVFRIALRCDSSLTVYSCDEALGMVYRSLVLRWK